MAYSKTTWQNGVTPINETNLNKIENQIELLSSTATVTNANGTAIKYPDGTLICYGTISATPTWDQWGSLYVGELTNLNKTFPISFTSVPIITATVTLGYSGGTGMISWVTSSATAIDNVNIIRPTTYSGPIFINYIAIGKWK